MTTYPNVFADYSKRTGAPANGSVLIDWPPSGIKVYNDYQYTFASLGAKVLVIDFIEWGFYAYRYVGENEFNMHLPATRIYHRLLDRLPKDHDCGYVFELILEILGQVYSDFIVFIRQVAMTNANVYVKRTSPNGILLEIYP